jgi:hypothetical protein
MYSKEEWPLWGVGTTHGSRLQLNNEIQYNQKKLIITHIKGKKRSRNTEHTRYSQEG